MSAKIISLLMKGFEQLVAQLSARLGDRMKKVGATDMAGCPRQAVLNRMNPPKRKLAEHIVLIMGHLVEDLIANLFAAGGFTNFKQSVELAHPEHDFIRVRVALLAENAKEVRVREIHSTKRNPLYPYQSWKQHIQAVVGITALNYPEKTVTGSLMAVDRATGDCKEYTGYTPSSYQTEYFVTKAKAIWAAMTGEGPVPEPEPGSLCGKCHHRSECPAHRMPAAKIPVDVLEAAIDYKILLAEKAKVERELERRKDEVLAFTGESFKGEKEGVSIKVSTTPSGAVRLDVTIKPDSDQLDLLEAA